MSAADDRAVIAALRAGHVGAGAVRAAAGLKAAPFKAAVQRLRYQGKVAWDALALTPSMMEIADAAPASPWQAPVPVAAAPSAAGEGEDAGAVPPVAPASEPEAITAAPASVPEPVRLLSAPEQLLRDIDAWCARTATAEIKLGAVALRHPGFVALLRKRLTATPDTIAKVRAVMDAHPEGMAKVPMPANNICVPKGPKSESSARAAAVARQRAVADLVQQAADHVKMQAAIADDVHRGISSVAEAVRQEAEASERRRRAARAIGGLAAAKLAVLPNASVAELVTTALAETVDDTARAMARRWPKTWARVLTAARAADERPGQTLIRLLELGLAQVEARRG